MPFKQLTILFYCLLCLGKAGVAQQPIATNEAYKKGFVLIVNEHFKGNQLDTAIWQNSFPWGRSMSSNMQYYTDTGNIRLAESTLSLTAKKQNYTGTVYAWDSAGNFKPYQKQFDYTSGMIYSKKSYKYGYFECRFKVPTGKGFNSAFWLYGPNQEEIDVFEILGSSVNKAQMTLHWKDDDPKTGYNQSVSFAKLSSSDFSQSYHTFGLAWNEKDINWFVDQKQVSETKSVNDVRNRHLPNNKLNPILTLEVGSLDGAPNSSTPFPSTMYVDYVRIYSQDRALTPTILGQEVIKTNLSKPFQLDLSQLKVQETNKTYPDGFMLNTYPDSRYQVVNNQIQVTDSLTDTLFVPISVNNGLQESNIYYLKIINTATKKQVNNVETTSAKPTFHPILTLHTITLETESYVKSGVLTIWNTEGQAVVRKNNYQPNETLALPALSEGIYSITFSNQHAFYSYKFIRMPY